MVVTFWRTAEDDLFNQSRIDFLKTQNTNVSNFTKRIFPQQANTNMTKRKKIG